MQIKPLVLSTVISVCMFGVLTLKGQGTDMDTTTTNVSQDSTNDSTLQGKLEKWYPGLNIFKSINISGSLDLTYQYNFNNPLSGNNSLRVFDTESNSAGVRLFQLMFEKQTKELNDVGFRVKLDVGQDAKVITPYGTSRDEFDFEEAYVTYKAPVGKGLDITFGKFATLHGAEVIESKDNYNISRSFLFGYAIPFTHTGILFGYPFNDIVSAKFGVVNGWDNLSDNNSSKSVHGMVSVTPNPQWSFTLGGTFGPEEYHNNHDNRSLVDIVGTYKPTDKLTFVTNYDYGQEPHASVTGTNAVWEGVAGYVNYAFTPKINVTGRAEWFSDHDGARTGTPQDLSEGTLTGEYKINDNFKCRLEYRHDHSNALSFENSSGGFSDNQDTLSFQTLFTF